MTRSGVTKESTPQAILFDLDGTLSDRTAAILGLVSALWEERDAVSVPAMVLSGLRSPVPGAKDEHKMYIPIG